MHQYCHQLAYSELYMISALSLMVFFLQLSHSLWQLLSSEVGPPTDYTLQDRVVKEHILTLLQ